MIEFYKKYHTNILNYDLLNKFQLKNASNVPVVTEVILELNFKTFDYDLLIRGLLTLELITGSRCSIITSKNSNTRLKLKKGSPIGCKIILKKKKVLRFFFFLINNKKLTNVCYKIISDKFYSAHLTISALNVPELQENYHFFKNVGSFNVKIFTTAKNDKEFNYLLNSYKLYN